MVFGDVQPKVEGNEGDAGDAWRPGSRAARLRSCSKHTVQDTRAEFPAVSQGLMRSYGILCPMSPHWCGEPHHQHSQLTLHGVSGLLCPIAPGSGVSPTKPLRLAAEGLEEGRLPPPLRWEGGGGLGAFRELTSQPLPCLVPETP